MADSKLRDRDAKDLLLKWPTRTKKLWSTPNNQGYWIQAQPKPYGENYATPTIRVPGASLFTTQPDGLWVYIKDDEFADIVAIEVCGSSQNLNDKRSRYSAAVRSLVLHCPHAWLHAVTPIQGAPNLPRWRSCRTIKNSPSCEVTLPVRFLRVLYALPNTVYREWTSHNVPGGHEYFCRHSSLDSYSSPTTQAFLKQMSFAGHFLTQIGR